MSLSVWSAFVARQTVGRGRPPSASNTTTVVRLRQLTIEDDRWRRDVVFSTLYGACAVLLPVALQLVAAVAHRRLANSLRGRLLLLHAASALATTAAAAGPDQPAPPLRRRSSVASLAARVAAQSSKVGPAAVGIGSGAPFGRRRSSTTLSSIRYSVSIPAAAPARVAPAPSASVHQTASETVTDWSVGTRRINGDPLQSSSVATTAAVVLEIVCVLAWSPFVGLNLVAASTAAAMTTADRTTGDCVGGQELSVLPSSRWWSAWGVCIAALVGRLAALVSPFVLLLHKDDDLAVALCARFSRSRRRTVDRSADGGLRRQRLSEPRSPIVDSDRRRRRRGKQRVVPENSAASSVVRNVPAAVDGGACLSRADVRPAGDVDHQSVGPGENLCSVDEDDDGGGGGGGSGGGGGGGGGGGSGDGGGEMLDLRLESITEDGARCSVVSLRSMT